MAIVGEKEAAEFIYRAMQLEDLEDVLHIEEASFRNPWTPDLFVNEFSNSRSRKRVIVEQAKGLVLAFGIYWLVLDEAHIMNIAVNPTHRRMGLGALILRQMLKEAKKAFAQRMTLEVRVSNEAAISLYQKEHFQGIGLRKNYYQREQEDALIMERIL